MKPSYKKYYEANKEAICARMREREAEKRLARRQYLAQHPEEIEAEREKNRSKYYTWKGNKILKRLNEWLKDDTISDSFKEFIRNHCLLNDTYAIFTPSDMATLEAMPKKKTTYELNKSRIVAEIQSVKNEINADKPVNEIVPASIDGAIRTLVESYHESPKGEEAPQD
jgi:hypothetical protein